MKESDIPTGSFAVVSPVNVEDMRRLPALYREKNIPFVFDPGQQIAALGSDDLKNGVLGAKVFISNDYELAQIMEKTGLTEDGIRKSAEIVVTTLGAKGSRIFAEGKMLEIPPVPAKKLVDPTGAGDAYRAGFMKGLLMGWPLETAGRFAGIIAAYAVEVHGPQEYKTTFAEARSRFAESFGMELPA